MFIDISPSHVRIFLTPVIIEVRDSKTGDQGSQASDNKDYRTVKRIMNENVENRECKN